MSVTAIEPNEPDRNTQLAWHLEEVAKTLAGMRFIFEPNNVLPGTQTWAHVALTDLAYKLKHGHCTATVMDRGIPHKELA